MNKKALLVLACVGLSVSPLWAVRSETRKTFKGVALDQRPQPPTPRTRQVFRHRATSAGAPRASGLEQRILSYLQTNPALLNLDQTPPLRVDYVKSVPGQRGLPERVYVNLIQVANGADVDGAYVSFSFNPALSELQLDDLHAQLYPDAIAVLPGPGDRASARERIRQRSGSARLQPISRKVRWLRGRWRTTEEFVAEDLGLHGAVDGSGQTYLWDDRVYASYSGKVSGRVIEFNPIVTGNNLVEVPLSSFKITDGLGTTVYTDNAGDYSLTTPSANSISVGVAGRWTDINDVTGGDLSVQITAGSPNPVNLLFNPTGNIETNTAQVDAYRHATLIHDWLAARNVQPAGIDVAIPTNVNVAGSCNAYYDYSSLNFYRSGGSCPNMAYDTVVYHEYGHFVDDKIGGITEGGLSEGWGDVLATYITGQSWVGEGFYGLPNTGLRNADNNYIYNAFDEVHNKGQAWMGFAWDLRTNLINSLGQSQGVALAEYLVIPTLWANSPDIPAAVRAVALRDDDDGNLSNGTPHMAAILAAANHHGLGFALDVTPPSAPANVVFSNPTMFQLQLSWPAATDNVLVTGYRVDVSSASDFSSLLPNNNNRDVGNVTTTFITGLAASTTYYARVRAYDGGGNTSVNSVTGQGVTLPPDIIPPTVQILSPILGATLQDLVTVSGTASDNQGLSQVRILVDGLQVGIATGGNGQVGVSTWTYLLDSFNISNGSHTLTARAVDLNNNQTDSGVFVVVSNQGGAVYSPSLKAPQCVGAVSNCSSRNLLNGRGILSTGPELNQPNTLAGSVCADGTFGTYHVDESVDRLRVYTLDGLPFDAGKTVRVETTVWVYSLFNSDALDLYYTTNASSPTWVFLKTILPQASGVQVLSSTFTLSNGSMQAVRANFRYQGSPAICTTGSYDDHDDLIFQVQASTLPDTEAPSIPANVAFSSPTTSSVWLSWSASTDNMGVAGYRVDLSTSSSFNVLVSSYANRDVGNVASALLSGLTSGATYYGRVRAYDGAQNVSTNSAVAQGLTLPRPPPTISISLLTGTTAFGMLEVSAYTISQLPVSRVDYFIDGQFVVSASSYPHTGYLDTTAFSNGPHVLTAIVYDTAGGSGTSNALSITVSNLTVFQDNFNGDLSAWTVRDEGTISAPSAWAITGGVLTQTSPIYGNDPLSSLAKPGTQLLTGSVAWTDYSFTSRMKTGNGSIGVVFRYKDSNNYYRWSMDPDGLQRLVQKVNGTFSLHDQKFASFVPGVWYTVTVDVKSYLLRIYINGQLAMQSNNASHARGGIGFYTWQTTDASFSGVKVLASQLPDTTPPTAPTNLVLSNPTTSSLNLSWNPSTDNVGVVGYQAEVSTQIPFIPLITWQTGIATNLVIPNLMPATTYYVRLRAFDQALNFSSYSAVAGMTLPAQLAPVITSSLTATGVVGSTFTYGITATNNPTSFNAVGLPAGLSIDTASGLISGLPDPGTVGTSSVTLSASNAGGTGLAILTLTIVDLTSPTVPTNVLLSSPTTSSLRVSWNPSTDDVGLFGYLADVSKNPDFSPPSYTTFALAGTLNFIQTGLTANTTYYARVRAWDKAGNLSDNSAVAAGKTLPFAPVITSSGSASGVVGSSFSYQITATNSPSSFGASGLPTGLVVDSVSGLISGVPVIQGTFTVTLSATNSGGTGTAILTISIVLPPDTVVPVLIIASPGPGSAWAKTVDIAGVAYDDRDLMDVMISIDGVVRQTFTSSGTFHYYWDTTLETNSGHTISVTARDAAFNTTTSDVFVIIDNLAPTVPTNVIWTNPTLNSMTLSWTASSDNLELAGYGVDISTDAAFGVLVSSYNVSPVPSTLISGLMPATTYFARVRAYDTLSNVSANSAVAAAKTLPFPPVITSSGSASGVVGSSFSYQITATNNPTSFNATGLPAGLSLNSLSGVISGVPVTVGTFPVTISAINAGGTGNATLSISIVLPPDTTPPVVTITSPVSGAVLSDWVYVIAQASDDRGVYQATVRIDGAPKTTITSTGPWYFPWNTLAESNGSHVISVTAFDTSFNASTATITVTVTNDSQAPSIPVNVNFSAPALTSLTLAWSASSDNVAVTGYRVDVSTVNNFVTTLPAYTNQDVGNVSSILVSGLIQSTTYFARVRAYDGKLNVSSNSAVATGVTLTPAPSSGTVAYDASLRVPRCSGSSSLCDSGTALLNGRANITNGREPNQPNTLSASTCADGSAGVYHSDESVDRIRVFTLDGTPLAAGKTVRVEVTAWVYSGYTSDFLDLYYAANANAPAWTFIGTIIPTGAGLRVLAANFTLPAGTSVQAVRANFRYLGTRNSCTVGVFNDHDDLAFQVGGFASGGGAGQGNVNADFNDGVIGDLGAPSSTPPVDMRIGVNLLNLSARVYPNPWRSDRHSGSDIIFDGLTPGSTIKIFTVAGHWVQTLSAPSGSVNWNRTNSSGETVASGLYIYLITDSLGNKAHGQLAIIR